MILTNDREKLLHVVAYFLENTLYCYKLKLYKLLHFADFQHFRETGRSITGLDYFAWDMGPVPAELDQEIKFHPQEDFVRSFTWNRKRWGEAEGIQINLRAGMNFNEGLFTDRELKILHQVARKFMRERSAEMSKKSHEEDQPWHRVYELEQRRSRVIPYIYGVPAEQQQVIEEASADYKALIQALR